jgi:ribosomal protein S18 acetylase RimI-like enzyme
MEVRELARSDLHRAAEFCDHVRAADPFIEPFGERLAAIAAGPRALLRLWRVAEEHGRIEGIAFASLREQSEAAPGAYAKADGYVAVAPHLRRHGLGQALCAPTLRWAALERATLRARIPDGAAAGRSFLTSLGFRQAWAQIVLRWSSRPIPGTPAGTVRVRHLAPGDALPDLERLGHDGWLGEPDAFARSSDELARLSREPGRAFLLADAGGTAVGYLCGVWTGATFAVEELAVLPEWRRRGVGRALLAAALRDASHAVLSVTESNGAALALYRAFGFAPSARRLIFERRHE